MRINRSAFSIILYLFAVSVGTVAEAIMMRGAQVEPKEAAVLIIRISTQDRHTIFSKVNSVLVRESGVPLTWPAFMPSGADKENPLYVNLRSTSRANYEIELGWVDGCLGGNACHYGTVRGSVAPLSENEGTRVPVELLGGIRGYFIDSTCHIHCDDSAIGWAEGNYHYSISIKAEKKETLIKVVNSAIAAGRG
jgi:hypothetical protein